jgi:hypothetical protein
MEKDVCAFALSEAQLILAECTLLSPHSVNRVYLCVASTGQVVWMMCMLSNGCLNVFLKENHRPDPQAKRVLG